mmetsp:Transcript_23078/g.46707  ORF Transcript_23078/g.46707 Transcript_23078/m.46707 type:complete len:582 (-) Transcript_23078:386-2131(-)
MEERLKEIGQEHLLQGLTDPQKAALEKQLDELDTQLPGKLAQYVKSAKQLLKDSLEGRTPFDGFKPAVPSGEKLPLGSEEFTKMDALGASAAVPLSAFVLVAGGLGERLGYNGIKVSLPLYIAEREKCFLQLYIEHILTMQASAGCKLPLAIMTSDDTHGLTEALLAEHNNFGMAPDQLHIVKQNKVPALLDSEARFAINKDGVVETKPHGHGDVHTLLHQSGLAKKWQGEGKKWVCFFQDTNGIIFRALPAVLGVSHTHQLDLNSVCVPRTPGEAVGAICKLDHEDGRSVTVNVEYNQLEPMLKASDNFKGGDVADPATGTSPFPGNINCLVFGIDRYVEVLEATGGMVKEFVNPKYADATKRAFKSPTRLECMMQDFPLLFPPAAKVGFTELDRLVCFSPVKNNIADAAAKARNNLPPECAGTAERDAILLNGEMLRMAGAAVEQGGGASGTFAGVPLQFGPLIILHPSFATSPGDVKKRLAGGELSVSARSSLVLEGDISFQGKVTVDGALVIRAAPGAKVVVKDLQVQNEGWETGPTEAGEEAADEMLRMRGYKVVKAGAKEYVFTEAGTHTVGASA